MATSGTHLDARTVGGARVLKPTRPDLTDAAFIKALGDQMYGVIREELEPKVVVDFSDVQRLSSAALGMLVALQKVVVEKKNGQLCLCGVADDLVEIFKMTRLDRAMKIHATSDEAVRSFR